jgi:formylglycine-generating enzyme required for sulfatase activity
MSGNVWEWVRDCYDKVEDDCRRVFRGGSWYNNPGDLRSSNRDWNSADNRHVYLGFRLAQDINQ